MRYKKSIKILNLIMIKSLKSKVGQKNRPITMITNQKLQLNYIQIMFYRMINKKHHLN